MSSTERDTHFAGFAKALIADLDTIHALRSDISYDLDLLIARRAYDFALHILREHSPAKMDMCPEYEWLDGVPDMPVLPEVQECG